MQQWEYLVLEANPLDTETTQDLLIVKGFEGWELISVTVISMGTQGFATRLFFKRPIIKSKE